VLYAILNTKSGRFLKVEPEKQVRYYDYEDALEWPVLKVTDSRFPGTVYVTDDKATAYKLLKPQPERYKGVRIYPDLYVECQGFTLADLKVVKLVQKKRKKRKQGDEAGVPTS
jgi:hypothetical protein